MKSPYNDVVSGVRPLSLIEHVERCPLCGIEHRYVGSLPDEPSRPETWFDVIDPIVRELRACHVIRDPQPIPLPIKLGGIFKLVRTRFTIRSLHIEGWYELTVQAMVPDRKDGNMLPVEMRMEISNRLLDLYNEDAVLEFCRRGLFEVMQHEVDEGLQRFNGSLYKDPHRNDSPV